MVDRRIDTIITYTWSPLVLGPLVSVSRKAYVSVGTFKGPSIWREDFNLRVPRFGGENTEDGQTHFYFYGPSIFGSSCQNFGFPSTSPSNNNNNNLSSNPSIAASVASTTTILVVRKEKSPKHIISHHINI
jgi:hypothetical protein